MYILNIASAIKNMSVNEIRNSNFKKCYKKTGFSKDNSHYSINHHKKRSTFLCN